MVKFSYQPSLLSETPIQTLEKLQPSFALVKETLTKTNPDYDIVIKRLHLYYYMKLVTLGTDRKRNLIIQFPVFIQPYTDTNH